MSRRFISLSVAVALGVLLPATLIVVSSRDPGQNARIPVPDSKATQVVGPELTVIRRERPFALEEPASDAERAEPKKTEYVMDFEDVPAGYPFDPSGPMPRHGVVFSDVGDFEKIARCLSREESVNPFLRKITTEEVQDILGAASKELEQVRALKKDYQEKYDRWLSRVRSEGQFPVELAFSSPHKAQAFAQDLLLGDEGAAYKRVWTIEERAGKFCVVIADPNRFLDLYTTLDMFITMTNALKDRVAYEVMSLR